MITTRCSACGKGFLTYPCRIKVTTHRFCSKECRNPFKGKALAKAGKKHRFKKGRQVDQLLYKRLAMQLKNDGHPKWKGEKVSYRGLHSWVRRNKGAPTKCVECGKESTKPRVIQWANIDHKYRRNLDDFIALCCSCHKLKDRANRDAPYATPPRS